MNYMDIQTFLTIASSSSLSKAAEMLYISQPALSHRLSALEKELGIKDGQCTSDGKFSLDTCRCVGACGLAPVFIVNGDVYGKATPDKVHDIIEKYK